jgi:hypothetical protein
MMNDLSELPCQHTLLVTLHMLNEALLRFVQHNEA